MARAGDRLLLYGATFLRALANGLGGVLLGIYLAKLGFSPFAIGGVLSAGLAGAVLATFIVTFDRSSEKCVKQQECGQMDQRPEAPEPKVRCRPRCGADILTARPPQHHWCT